MPLSDLISTIQTILAVGLFYYAYREFHQWRIEFVGSKRIDSVLMLGKAVIRLQSAFNAARNPFSYEPDEETAKNIAEKAKLESDHYRLKQEYEFNLRIGFILTALKALDEAHLECQLLIKEDITDYIKQLNKKYGEFKSSLYRIHHKIGTESQFEEAYSVLYSVGGAEDKFGVEISKITENIQRIVRFYLK